MKRRHHPPLNFAAGASPQRPPEKQFALKHAFIDDEHGWEAMTLILFIGFNLFEILKTQLREEGIIQTIRRVTYKWIAQLIQRAMSIVYGTDQTLCLDSS